MLHTAINRMLGKPSLVKTKLSLIDTAFRRFGARTFADLGGEEAYSVYAVEKWGGTPADDADVVFLFDRPDLKAALKRYSHAPTLLVYSRDDPIRTAVELGYFPVQVDRDGRNHGFLFRKMDLITEGR